MININKDIIVLGNSCNYRVSFYKDPLRCALKGFFVCYRRIKNCRKGSFLRILAFCECSGKIDL